MSLTELKDHELENLKHFRTKPGEGRGRGRDQGGGMHTGTVLEAKSQGASQHFNGFPGV